MIELMVVVGVIAVLALLAAPSISDKIVRDQVVEAAKLIEFAKPPIQVSWATLATMPVDNAAAGLPPATSIVNNVVSSVAVESGAIQITFGNRANAALRGKMLSFRPGVVEASPIVPITWVCGHASPPVPMNARGLDKTNIPDRYLPLNCRAAATGPSAACPHASRGEDEAEDDDDGDALTIAVASRPRPTATPIAAVAQMPAAWSGRAPGRSAPLDDRAGAEEADAGDTPG